MGNLERRPNRPPRGEKSEPLGDHLERAVRESEIRRDRAQIRELSERWLAPMRVRLAEIDTEKIKKFISEGVGSESDLVTLLINRDGAASAFKLVFADPKIVVPLGNFADWSPEEISDLFYVLYGDRDMNKSTKPAPLVL